MVKVVSEIDCVLGGKSKTILVHPTPNIKFPNFKKSGSHDLILQAVQ